MNSIRSKESSCGRVGRLFAMACVLHACASPSVELKLSDPQAVIREVDPEGQVLNQQIGVGAATLSDGDLKNKVYVFEKPGMLPTMMMVLNNPQALKISVQLKPQDTKAQEELEAAKQNISALQKMVDRLSQEKSQLKETFEKDAQALVMAQYYLALGSSQNAATEIAKITDSNNLPAVGHYLGAQIEITKGNETAAVELLKKSLSRNPQFIEARRLLEALEK